MFPKYVWLLLAFATACLLYAQNYFAGARLDFVRWSPSFLDVIYDGLGESSITNEMDVERKVFTVDELKKYANLEDGLYLSVLGQVFDVTKGAKHYGPGGTYHAFTGRDASLAFVTGQFDPKGLTDDVSSLSAQQVKALNDWVEFYHKNYVYKGKLNGRYYDENGTPTIESRRVKEKLKRAEEEKFLEEQKKRMFPPCNVEWRPETGSVVWCNKLSGGIQRDWVGVPRMLFEFPGSQQYRCACVKLDSPEYKEAKGRIREYVGCAEAETKCFIKPNGPSNDPPIATFAKTLSTLSE